MVLGWLGAAVWVCVSTQRSILDTQRTHTATQIVEKVSMVYEFIFWMMFARASSTNFRWFFCAASSSIFRTRVYIQCIRYIMHERPNTAHKNPTYVNASQIHIPNDNENIIMITASKECMPARLCSQSPVRVINVYFRRFQLFATHKNSIPKFVFHIHARTRIITTRTEPRSTFYSTLWTRSANYIIVLFGSYVHAQMGFILFPIIRIKIVFNENYAV